MLTIGLLAGCTPDEPPTNRPEPPDPTVDTDEPPDTDPPDPTTPTEPEPVVGGEWLLETDAVRDLYLVIGHDELDSLAVAPDSWVPANVTIGDLEVVRIAVRLKGNGSFQPIDQKPSFKISADRYVEGQELDGLDDLALNNMVTDASFLRERLAYEAYREAGVPAPRSAHVRLVVNGEPYGLYLLMEGVDKRFLERWYDDGEGPLYEMFDVEFTPSAVWQFEHDGGPDDRSALVGLADVLADPQSRLSEDAAPFLDLDRFVAYFGASAVVGQFDAYPYSVPGDDVYLYVDPADGKIDFLPHGADESFTDAFRPADYVFGLLAIRCLEDPACDAAWNDAVWAAQTAIEDTSLVDSLDGWWSDISDVAQADPKVPWTLQESVTAYDAVRAFVDGRRARLEEMPGLE